jgi:MFS family permease
MAVTEADQGPACAVAERPADTTLWRNGDFVKFWYGESISLVGGQITALALPLTAVTVLGVGPGALGLLRFLEMIPFLLFGLLFGVWADRARRRPLMLASNLVRLVLVAAVPILWATGNLDLWLLYVVAFGVGSATVLFDVGWMSYVPALVRDPRQLVDANSKLGASAAGAEAAGPGIAGVLVSALTAPVALVVDACSYVVSLISLLLIRRPEPRPPRREHRRLLADLREGMGWVFRDPLLRAVGVVAAMCNFFTTATQTMFILYAIDDRGVSAGTLGLILSAGAVGGLLGALLAGRVIGHFPLGRVYAGSIAVAFCAPTLIPAAGGSHTLMVGMWIAAFFFTWAGVSVVNVVIISLRQTVTPAPLLGRMNAAMRTLMIGMAAVGAPVAGLLAGVIGVQGALWASAAGSLALVAAVWRSPVRRLRQMPPGPNPGPPLAVAAGTHAP